MELTVTILGIVGSVVSIVGAVLSVIKKQRTYNIVLYGFLVIVSVGGAYCFHQYQKVTDEKLNLEKRKDSVRTSAKQLLKRISSTSYWYPGENEGLILSALALLEENKDIYPETFQVYKADVIEKLQLSNHKTSMSDRREELEVAGESALRILKTLAE